MLTHIGPASYKTESPWDRQIAHSGLSQDSDHQFIQMQKLAPGDSVENGSLGWSSALGGGVFFNGDYNATANGNARQGAVYINR
jgi:hypothetical protein